MRQPGTIVSGVRRATLIVAGALLLGASAPVAAQDAAPTAQVQLQVFEYVDTFAPASWFGGEAELISSESTLSAIPATEIGAGVVAGETGPMGIGALVGAGVAAVYALRERFKHR